jgi:hypothetical protein
MDADATGLYYEAAGQGVSDGQLVHVLPAGAVRRSAAGAPSDAPLAVRDGQLLLVDVVSEPSGRSSNLTYDAATLQPVASNPRAAGVVSLASTGAGILGVTIPCKVQVCGNTKVLRLSATTGTQTASLALPGAQLVLRGPSPVAVVYHGGHVELARLTS